MPIDGKQAEVTVDVKMACQLIWDIQPSRILNLSFFRANRRSIPRLREDRPRPKRVNQFERVAELRVVSINLRYYLLQFQNRLILWRVDRVVGARHDVPLR